MDNFVSPETLNQVAGMLIIAIGGLAVAVIGMFRFLLTQPRKVIETQDKRIREFEIAQESTSGKIREQEELAHRQSIEISDLKDDVRRRDIRIDEMSKQLTEVLSRANRQDEEISKIRGEQESERRYMQGRIEAESGARQKAELKAVEYESKVQILITENKALLQRIDDQERIYKAEIAALKEQTARLEAESKLMGKSIDDRVRTATEAATRELRQELDKLVKERGALESRLHELESKGVTTNEA